MTRYERICLTKVRGFVLNLSIGSHASSEVRREGKYKLERAVTLLILLSARNGDGFRN